MESLRIQLRLQALVRVKILTLTLTGVMNSAF